LEPGLSVCPLCRADLDRLGGPKYAADGRVTCPSCSGELSEFIDIKQRALALGTLVRELLSRGDAARGRRALEQLAKLASPAEIELAPLWCRLALLEGELEQAQQLADSASDIAERELLRGRIAQLRDSRLRARELYNYALSCARRGASRDAAGHLDAAVKLDPDDPMIWALRLKADLKQQRFNECYRDLAELDRLAARPPEFYLLEQLLPPLAAG
jgi:tetratricopeptide (TPR) repeat protein